MTQLKKEYKEKTMIGGQIISECRVNHSDRKPRNIYSEITLVVRTYASRTNTTKYTAIKSLRC